MSALIAAAHAKLNWLLDVVGVRLDGYHELDMLTQSLALADQLTFASADKLMLWVDGAPCDDEANLVLRAARLMQREARAPLGAAITLSKNIPVRAGLGGGSADCAATLLALNRLWGLNLHPDTLAQLGCRWAPTCRFAWSAGFAACAAWASCCPRCRRRPRPTY
ncbi:MAG: hypothetical protein GX558_04100 [Clostridiales bacterium]|nr:hypothetical protein [Clostridiales bacterium]